MRRLIAGSTPISTPYPETNGIEVKNSRAPLAPNADLDGRLDWWTGPWSAILVNGLGHPATQASDDVTYITDTGPAIDDGPEIANLPA